MLINLIFIQANLYYRKIQQMRPDLGLKKLRWDEHSLDKVYPTLPYLMDTKGKKTIGLALFYSTSILASEQIEVVTIRHHTDTVNV